MIDGLAPYRDTRPVDLPGLDRLPEHWQVVRLKTLFREVDERSGSGIEPLLSLRMKAGLVDHHESGGNPVPPTALEHYKIARPGQIVMNRMRAATGLFGIPPKLGLVSPDYAVLQPQGDLAPGYFVALFKTPLMMSSFRAESRGLGTGEAGFMRLYTDRFGMLATPLPPQVEQATIVRFLNTVNDRVGRYVRAKQQTIKLLEEQRKLILRRAVTAGSDPQTTLRASGVPSLGDIPAHWEVRRIKTLFQCLDSRRIPISATERGKMTRRQYDYYGASGVIDKVDDFIFDNEDLILIAEDGANLVLRNLPLAIIARGQYWVNNHAHILRPIEGGDMEFLAARLEAMCFRPWITGAAQPKLTKDRLMAVALSVPAPEEQRSIMEHVRQETQTLAQSIATARREVELMTEYQTRLSSDVVTGKLDVRAGAADLPDDIEMREVPEELTDLEYDEEAEEGGELELEEAEA